MKNKIKDKLLTIYNYIKPYGYFNDNRFDRGSIGSIVSIILFFIFLVSVSVWAIKIEIVRLTAVLTIVLVLVNISYNKERKNH